MKISKDKLLKDLAPEELEDLEKFRTWLLGYLCQATKENLLVRRLHDHVVALWDYEPGFQDRLEGKEKKIVQFKPRQPKPQLVITNEASND
jgi:hypothetical protein